MTTIGKPATQRDDRNLQPSTAKTAVLHFRKSIRHDEIKPRISVNRREAKLKNKSPEQREWGLKCRDSMLLQPQGVLVLKDLDKGFSVLTLDRVHET